MVRSSFSCYSLSRAAQEPSQHMRWLLCFFTSSFSSSLPNPVALSAPGAAAARTPMQHGYSLSLSCLTRLHVLGQTHMARQVGQYDTAAMMPAAPTAQCTHGRTQPQCTFEAGTQQVPAQQPHDNRADFPELQGLQEFLCATHHAQFHTIHVPHQPLQC